MKKILFLLALTLSVVGTSLYGCSKFTITCNYIDAQNQNVPSPALTQYDIRGINMLPQACGTYSGTCGTNHGFTTWQDSGGQATSTSSYGEAARAFCLGYQFAVPNAIRFVSATATCT
jgi:hypothetical protein